MTGLLSWRTGVVGVAGLIAMATLTATAGSQQKPQNAGQRNETYDVTRETVVQGKVLEYTRASTVPPVGPHVTVQTASGVVDVHLGNARLLEANGFSLASGESIRIVGENVAYGSGAQFLARIIQKGNQVLVVRSVRGFPLVPGAKSGQRTGGAL